ncbi:MAG TPA: J domain-containing protein [bacterium]|nr:J domain-containing protein [bacterium]
MSNHYAVLGVLPSASTDEIKASYRQLAKRYHPDVAGGNARFFARIREAYDVLSEPDQRRVYDARSMRAAPPPRATAGGRPAPASDATAAGATTTSRAPLPVLTRIMSITVPRSGRFQLQGLIGDIHIVATTPETLWDTTLRKYGTTDRERLARHVIQIKLSGERELVRSMMPRPTDFGVEFERASGEEKQRRLRTFMENLLGRGPFGNLFSGRGFGLYGAHLPLTLQVTVPRGTPLFLRDVTGAITVGNVESEVVAKLLGGVMRTGRITRAHLTLNGGSRAFLSDVRGPVDLMGFGSSRTYVGGRISRLRAVLENDAQAEVTGAVGALLAEVNGRSQLDVKQPVREAHCDVADTARVRLARVQRLSGTRAAGARLDATLERGRMSKAG